jgi:4-alpha-glucanotransferase
LQVLLVPREVDQDLVRLADRLGVLTSFSDVEGQEREASVESLRAVTAALLGADIADPKTALRHLDGLEAGRLLEPVVVAWEGARNHVRIRLEGARPDRVECEVVLEDGTAVGWRPTFEVDVSGGVSVALPARLPAGYHRLRLRTGSRHAESLLVCAPRIAFRDPARPRDWAVFLPLYALHSRSSLGAGDFSDLRELIRWARSLGASMAGTLPILAQFYDAAMFDPSPYAPASRLMWNEVYLDLQALPEWTGGLHEGSEFRAQNFQSAVSDQNRERYVDWAAYAELRRSVLYAAASFESEWPRPSAGHRGSLADTPLIGQYARFRARSERHGPWRQWPSAEPDFDTAAERYHRYAQWACREQLERLAADSARALYLDLPLGVHASGFDTWRWPECFLPDLSAGAPPDALGPAGQYWGFPPLHPRANRAQEYAYLRAYLRHHMQYAGRLRIDHVMGLHRLYCIPAGMPAREGLYVRYPAEELYAILCLESHRYRTEVVGENLGTVPDYVNEAMRRHGIAGMYVLPFEIDTGAAAIREPAADTVACLNTHDLPTFESWWAERDIDLGTELGVLDQERAGDLRRARAAEKESALVFLESRRLLGPGRRASPDVYRALMRYLAESPARTLLVNLEDLWGETEPQNVPGTSSQRPNWRRKARLGLEEMQSLEAVRATLKEIDRARRKSNT